MFFRDLKPKPKTTLRVVLAEAHLPVKLGHRDAEKVFGEPLKAQLAAAGLGSVTACTLRKRTSGTVSGVDIALALTDGRDSALQTVAAMLESLSAPCGSSIRLTDGVGDPVLFGLTEGLELAIETPLAPDADSRRDITHACKAALDHEGVSRGWDHARDKTVFYFYGESYGEMRARLARILKAADLESDVTIRRMA